MPLSAREVIRMLEADGWRLAQTRGDHLQFKHPTKPGLVTVQAGRKDMSRKGRWARSSGRAGSCSTPRSGGEPVALRHYPAIIEPRR